MGGGGGGGGLWRLPFYVRLAFISPFAQRLALLHENMQLQAV